MPDTPVYESLFDQLPRHLACHINPLVSEIGADFTLENVSETLECLMGLHAEVGPRLETFFCSFALLATSAAAMRYEAEGAQADTARFLRKASMPDGEGGER